MRKRHPCNAPRWRDCCKSMRVALHRRLARLELVRTMISWRSALLMVTAGTDTVAPAATGLPVRMGICRTWYLPDLVFAGLGGSRYLAFGEMHARLRTLLERMAKI
jgi:hypothetical protein